MSAGPYASILAGELALATPRFALRPLQAEDAPDLLAHLADPDVIAFMDVERFSDIAQAKATIGWAEQIRQGGTGVRWAVRAEGGEFVGTAGFNVLVWERGCRGEIAYDVGPRFWGARVMDEVLPVILGFGFRSLGLRRIEALVTTGNAPSCRLLERHGFAREGVLHDYGFWKDRFWDQIIYAKLG